MSGTGREGENNKAASDPYLPTDLCEEILYRLRSNDLLNFKLVSKDWLRLISSKRFIQKHLQRSKADCINHPKIIFPLLESSTAIIDCANNASKEISSDHMHILGCCDGLVLYYGDSTIAALNPSTGRAAVVVGTRIEEEEDDDALIFSWFGHHPSTGEYVLALANWSAVEETEAITLKAFSLSLAKNETNIPVPLSSSTLELDACFYPNDHESRIGTLLHGRLHYPANYEHSVLVYDFETNKIMRMSTPPYVEYGIQVLGVVDGCLCAIQEKQVWIMEEYGVEESWTKYAKVEGYEDGAIPLAFCPNGDVIVTENSTTSSRYGVTIADNYSSKLSRYSFKEKEIHTLKAYKNCMIGDECIACIDSLVSPASLFGEDDE